MVVQFGVAGGGVDQVLIYAEVFLKKQVGVVIQSTEFAAHNAKHVHHIMHIPKTGPLLEIARGNLIRGGRTLGFFLTSPESRNRQVSSDNFPLALCTIRKFL